MTRGLENQAALRTHEKVRTVAPSPQQARRLKVDVVKTVPATVREASGTVVEVKVVPQEQEQEPEPWRSTRKGNDPDVVAPSLTLNVNPKYTADALRAKIQGTVPVEVIVSPDGNVTAVRVIKSLDKVFGLDEEAVKAAWQWKFLPGTYQGQPVALRVKIEMEFRVHR
jgi:protein TonB